MVGININVARGPSPSDADRAEEHHRNKNTSSSARRARAKRVQDGPRKKKKTRYPMYSEHDKCEHAEHCLEKSPSREKKRFEKRLYMLVNAGYEWMQNLA
jgi:hypothetical protein